MFFTPMLVNMLGFKVNAVERNAAVTIGPYQQIDTFLSNKQNQGFGDDNGDFITVFVPLNIVIDSDVSDSNAAKASVI